MNVFIALKQTHILKHLCHLLSLLCKGNEAVLISNDNIIERNKKNITIFHMKIVTFTALKTAVCQNPLTVDEFMTKSDHW